MTDLAKIALPDGFDVQKIVEAAGGDCRLSLLHDGVLTVPGVAQTALAAALAAYDHRAAMLAAKVAAVKAEAGRRILAIIPDWQQRNLTARAAVLAAKGQANWTADEAAEWSAGQALWNRANAIRTASNAIEADLAAIADGAAINAYDINHSARWPE